ncbi:opsin-3 [Callorhinchus milii]|nr:opsin-3 [Callorhinchus milii]|eukprot:gi/632952901/ref/XP_007892106.1/ PREDICTED: opsin-3 [Callorhinchus milii]
MNPTNSTEPQEEHLFSPNTYKLLAVIIGTIGIVGFCNNILVLLLYYKFKRLRTPTNLLLVNISVSDLLVSVFGLSFTFVSCTQGRWGWDSAACVWDGFSHSLFGTVSIVTLTVLAYERYIRVVNAKATNFPWAWRAITYTWFYSLAWSGAPLVGWNRYSLELHRLGCAVNWISRDPNDTLFVLFFFLGCLVVPVGVMAYCYGNVLYTIRMLRTVQDLQTVQVMKILRYERKVAKMCFLMISTFLICWMPYAVVSFMVAYGYTDVITPAVAIAPSFIAKSSTAYNPIIYIFMSRKYRRCLSQLFCSHLMSLQWSIKDPSSKARNDMPVKPIVLSQKGDRPKKRVTFSSSSIVFIITSDDTQELGSIAGSNATQISIVQVQPL